MSRSLLSVVDLNREDIMSLIDRAEYFRKENSKSEELRLRPQVGGLLFFEASTRTRIGFEVAAWKLGVKSVLLNQTRHTPAMGKSEGVADTVRALDAYVDFYCVRHTDEKVLVEITESTNKPVINCGNGSVEHPTQALIDVYAIWTRYGGIDGRRITLLGDLLSSRSAHSLVLLLSKFRDIQLISCAPKGLQLPNSYVGEVSHRNSIQLRSVPDWKSEIIYSAGFPSAISNSPGSARSNKAREQFMITKAIADEFGKDCTILNPLPRIDEIEVGVDETPAAYYFKQNELGLFMRMAILERFCL